MESGMRCTIDGCHRDAWANELCPTHLKRKQRDRPVAAPVRAYGRTPAERVRHAALRLAQAETDDDYRRADDLLAKYSRARSRTLRRESARRKLSNPDPTLQGCPPGSAKLTATV